MGEFEFLELDHLDELERAERAVYEFVYATDSFLFDPYPEEQAIFDSFAD